MEIFDVPTTQMPIFVLFVSAGVLFDFAFFPLSILNEIILADWRKIISAFQYLSINIYFSQNLFSVIFSLPLKCKQSNSQLTVLRVLTGNEFCKNFFTFPFKFLSTSFKFFLPVLPLSVVFVKANKYLTNSFGSFCFRSDIFVLKCFNYETFINRENEVVRVSVLYGSVCCMHPHNWYYFVTSGMRPEHSCKCCPFTRATF